MRCEDFGAVGLAIKSAPTLRAAFSRQHRYTRLFNTASQFSLQVTADGARWRHHRSEPAREGLAAALIDTVGVTAACLQPAERGWRGT